MMRSKKKSFGVYSIYRKLLQRLPNTYPRPTLIVHASLTELRDLFWNNSKRLLHDDPGYPPYAFCDGIKNTVHISLQLNKEPKENILKIYLHEIGHLYAFKKYGETDKRWDDVKEAERFADRFALRWLSRLKKERWL